MNISSKLLMIKDLNPLQKLILGLILNTHPVVIQFAGGCDLTCGAMAKELGMTRTPIRKEVDALIELGYISTRWGKGWRLSNVTDKLLKLL